jgi:cytochrome P450
MRSLFLALVLFPQVQRRAQAELDVVIGRDRLPTFDDRPRLPYIEALCKELLRWNMVTPIGTNPSRVARIRMTNYFQVFLTGQVKMMFIRAFLFQKVRMLSVWFCLTLA